MSGLPLSDAEDSIIVTEPVGRQLSSLQEEHPEEVSALLEYIQSTSHNPGGELTAYSYNGFTYKLQERNTDGRVVLLSVSY